MFIPLLVCIAPYVFQAPYAYATPIIYEATIQETPEQIKKTVKQPIKKTVKKPTSWYETPQWDEKGYRAQRIREISYELWYDNPELAVKIARCESWLNPTIKNKYSSAGWLFQQLWSYRPARAKKYWWEWYSRFDWEANAHVSIMMLKHEWTRHWNESKRCWWK